MPIYEFSCSGCHKEFEQLLRTSSLKGIRCPKCGSSRVSKKLSVFASAAGASARETAPACSGNPRSCGRCCTGVPHSH